MNGLRPRRHGAGLQHDPGAGTRWYNGPPFSLSFFRWTIIAAGLAPFADRRNPTAAFTSAPPSSSHSLRTESHITIALELRVRQLRAEGVILDGGRRARRQTNINLDVPANGPAQ